MSTRITCFNENNPNRASLWTRSGKSIFVVAGSHINCTARRWTLSSRRSSAACVRVRKRFCVGQDSMRTTDKRTFCMGIALTFHVVYIIYGVRIDRLPEYQDATSNAFLLATVSVKSRYEELVTKPYCWEMSVTLSFSRASVPRFTASSNSIRSVLVPLLLHRGPHQGFGPTRALGSAEHPSRIGGGRRTDHTESTPTASGNKQLSIKGRDTTSREGVAYPSEKPRESAHSPWYWLFISSCSLSPG